mmetsp:Transcript_77055/g.222883  ORF Transcript_77055/g.222883 Transcript_77055/m.222883 type:complete len:272 (-) Transcript_77055:206-1021(-)
MRSLRVVAPDQTASDGRLRGPTTCLEERGVVGEPCVEEEADGVVEVLSEPEERHGIQCATCALEAALERLVRGAKAGEHEDLVVVPDATIIGRQPTCLMHQKLVNPAPVVREAQSSLAARFRRYSVSQVLGARLAATPHAGVGVVVVLVQRDHPRERVAEHGYLGKPAGPHPLQAAAAHLPCQEHGVAVLGALRICSRPFSILFNGKKADVLEIGAVPVCDGLQRSQERGARAFRNVYESNRADACRCGSRAAFDHDAAVVGRVRRLPLEQ